MSTTTIPHKKKGKKINLLKNVAQVKVEGEEEEKVEVKGGGKREQITEIKNS